MYRMTKKYVSLAKVPILATRLLVTILATSCRHLYWHIAYEIHSMNALLTIDIIGWHLVGIISQGYIILVSITCIGSNFGRQVAPLV